MGEDWREEARVRRIPVWQGAFMDGALDDERYKGHGRYLVAEVAEGEGQPCTFIRTSCDEGDHYELVPVDGVLALADPDTQAAYLRRLALARGWQGEADHGFGVVMWRGYDSKGRGPLGWYLQAGTRDETRIPACGDTTDRLLALARAWPHQSM